MTITILVGAKGHDTLTWYRRYVKLPFVPRKGDYIGIGFFELVVESIWIDPERQIIEVFTDRFPNGDALIENLEASGFAKQD